MPAMPVVGTAVDPRIVVELDAIAKRDGITRSVVLRQIIEMALEKRKAWKPPTVTPPKV